MEIGEKIKELRIKKGVSQELLADQLRISRQSISKWERGVSKPSSNNLVCIANFFDIAIEELLDNQFNIGVTYNSQAELLSLVKNKRNIIITFLLFTLFLITFIPSVYLESISYNQDIIFMLVTTSGVAMFALYLFVVSQIMYYVYKDGKNRGIKTRLFIIISFTIIGFLIYLLCRDSLSEVHQ